MEEGGRTRREEGRKHEEGSRRKKGRVRGE